MLARARERAFIVSAVQIDWLGGALPDSLCRQGGSACTSRLAYVDRAFELAWDWYQRLDPEPKAYDPDVHPWSYPRSQAIVFAWVRTRDLLGADAPCPITSADLHEFDGKPHPLLSPEALARRDHDVAPASACGGHLTCPSPLWPPIVRTWVPSGTPLFSTEGTWFGFALGVFLLGPELRSPHPLLACHEAYYSVLRAVCVPRFLRAPRCARGW